MSDTTTDWLEQFRELNDTDNCQCFGLLPNTVKGEQCWDIVSFFSGNSYDYESRVVSRAATPGEAIRKAIEEVGTI